MSFESDMHMALCVLKIFALLVIAYSLWKVTSDNQGYYIRGKMSTASQNVVPGPYGSSLPGWGPSSAGLGLAVEQSQSGVGNATFKNPGYEAPVWNNTGDISTYEGQQATQAGMGIVTYNDVADAAQAAAGHMVGNRQANLVPY